MTDGGDETSTTVEPAPTNLGLPQISGRLDSFPSFEILQVVSDLRKRGELRMQNEDGRGARCVVASGVVFEASCGHLAGVEALVAMSWWDRGTFELLPIGPDPPAGSGLRLPEVLMDAVRIADEIERRNEHLPSRDVPLTLVPGAAPPEDGFDCDLPAIFSHLERNPATTLVELEESLPIAPTKIRLGVALLCEAGLVVRAARGASSAASSLDDDSWWRRILGRYPGGIRALVTCPSDGSPDDAFSAVSRIAAKLGMPRPALSYAPDGPSFVRIRPQGGGILSFTLLPLSRKHRYLFLALVKSVEIVFFSPDDFARAELEEWEEMIPKMVKIVRLARRSAIDEEIAENLQQLEEEIHS